ncbi:hypothetical protein [Bradyrhizobium sp. SSUT77]|uniref:hypothetical protein n=1 Tax=Bradyrhizobium sp. SSUT77 TaxID=3040603 RepID=UPI00244C78A1|nr:hypothetical protein [Bradyrhizobium sp. SSUT77]MDH2342732.1 hypothetical protein [Bradyrhizobium sp. SSUT77]
MLLVYLRECYLGTGNRGQGMARKGTATSESIAAANEKVEKEVARRKRTVRSFPAAPFEGQHRFCEEHVRVRKR